MTLSLLLLVTACAPAETSTSAQSSSSSAAPSNALAPQVAPYEVPHAEMVGIRITYDGAVTTVSSNGRLHRLHGRFSFDALSPNQRLFYLIEHRPPAGSEDYRVRLLDLRSGHLREQPIADKRNLETDMSGLPMARATTTDGVWVFTLYRGKQHSFVHALNTRHAFARCLDLPHGCCSGSGEWRLELDEEEEDLSAVAGSLRDTVTFNLVRRLGADAL